MCLYPQRFKHACHETRDRQCLSIASWQETNWFCVLLLNVCVCVCVCVCVRERERERERERDGGRERKIIFIIYILDTVYLKKNSNDMQYTFI